MAISRTETLMWTALPGGLGTKDSHGTQYLRLSVYLSPRLETTAPSGRISEFPDFSGSGANSNWASLIQGVSFDVEFLIAGLAPVRRTVDSSQVRVVSGDPDPELWERVFPDTMPYKAFKFRDLSTAKINTFAVKGVSGVVKQQYQVVAATPLLMYRPPTISQLVKLPGITNPPLMRVLPTSAAVSTAAAGTPVQDANFKAFEQFHIPWVKPAGYEPPPIPPMDFHKALSALGNYPLLLQYLGIVVTLEVPFSSALKGAVRVRALPVWPEGFLSAPYLSSDGLPITRKNASPWTVCALPTRATTVGTKIATTATGFSALSKDGKIKDGYLVARGTSTTSVSADPTQLYNYSVDLAAMRLIGAAAAAAKINPPVASQQAAGAGGASAAAITPVRVSAAVLQQRAAEPMGLPTLGHPVISMTVPGLAAHIGSKFVSAAAKNALLAAGQDESILNYAEDLTRGYRVDVWDSQTRHWHKLCERTGTYAIGDAPILWNGNPTLTDEGWVQFGAVSAPEDASSDEPPQAMRIHESVFDWSGWSLSVTRPGTPLSELDAEGNSTPKKTFVGPDGEEHEVGHYLHPDLPLDTRFTVPAASLPRLRFGTTYRFRARAVDLAGQSVPFAAGSTTANPGGATDTLTTVSRALAHQRFDPVKPATVVLDEPTKPGEAPEVLVVRSYTPPAASKVTEATKRHIAPPRTSVQMAEATGGLDDGSVAAKPMDKALWSTLVARDAWDFPKNPDGTQVPISGWTPAPALPSPVPYLPDRYSKGVALNGLPGAPVSVTTRTVATGVRYKGVKIPKTSTTSITKANLQIDFNVAGSKWYEKQPFQIVVNGIEALDSRVTPHASPADPVWDASRRILTVQLPKAEQITVDLSSYMDPADIAKMGVYNWGIEKHIPALAIRKTPAIASTTSSAGAVGIAAIAAAAKVPVAPSTKYTAAVNALISTSVIGSNWMITPATKLTLVHAVDTPLITPHFTSRAHAERKQGEVHAAIVDWMPINGKSTSKLDVKAAWKETIDTGTGAPKWGPTAVASSGHAFTLSPQTGDTTVLNGGASTPAHMVNTYWGVIPKTGMVVNTRNLSTQRHFFGDTKHRRVDYTATAASRFEKYFVDKSGLTFTASSTAKTLHVPSSSRPAPPQIDYIIPIFGWTRSTTSSTRSGGGLRVYLKRPWFSTGEDECLGVVLWQVSSSWTGTGAAEPFVTQWGHDPMFSTAGHLPVSWPQLSHFKETAWKRMNLPLVEAPSGGARTVMAAAYPVDYDAESDRWFADVVIDQGSAYFPFVKLSLARFQPYALAGLELSAVVLADFAQLTPERNASVAWSGDRSSFTLTVSGNTYTNDYAGKSATVTVCVERKLVGEDVVGWTAVTSETDLSRLPRTRREIARGIHTAHWRKSVTMPTQTAGYEYRIVIREYEWHLRHGETTKIKRLVYAETLPVNP